MERPALGHYQDVKKSLHALDDGQNNQQLDLPEQKREIDLPNARQHAGTIDRRGVEDLLWHRHQTAEIDQERKDADPWEAHEDDRSEGDAFLAEPGMFP